MVALPLVDSVFSEASPTERTRSIVSQLVQAAVDELLQIELLDHRMAPESPAQFDRKTAALLRDEYERWAGAAERLLERVDHFESIGILVPDSDRLRRAYGKTRARLSISLDDMQRSMRDIVQRRVAPVEEVRRGLHNFSPSDVMIK